MSVQTHQHLIALEKELLEPEIRKSPQRLNELLSDDFFEFGQWGEGFDKKSMIELLPQLPEEKLTASIFQVRSLSNDIILLTYFLERDGGKFDKSRSSRSSIWKKNGDSWQMIFHQGTPITESN